MFEVYPNIFLLDELQCYIRDDIGFGLGGYTATIIKAAAFLWYMIVLKKIWKNKIVLKIYDYQLAGYGNVFKLSDLLNKKEVNVVDEICKKLEHDEAIIIKLWLWN